MIVVNVRLTFLDSMTTKQARRNVMQGYIQSRTNMSQPHAPRLVLRDVEFGELG